MTCFMGSVESVLKMCPSSFTFLSSMFGLGKLFNEVVVISPQDV